MFARKGRLRAAPLFLTRKRGPRDTPTPPPPERNRSRDRELFDRKVSRTESGKRSVQDSVEASGTGVTVTDYCYIATDAADAESSETETETAEE